MLSGRHMAQAAAWIVAIPAICSGSSASASAVGLDSAPLRASAHAPGVRAPGPDWSLLISELEAISSAAAGKVQTVGPDHQAISASWAGEPAVRVGGRITVTGKVTQAAGVIRIDRRADGEWEPVTAAEPAADGSWSARIRAVGIPSSQLYRAVWTIENSRVADATLPSLETYRLNTYEVSTRGRVATDVEEFAATVAAIYADERGWKGAHQHFRQVRRGGDFTLVLAQAQTLRSFSPTCSVQYSCRVARYVVINETPWRKATPAFTGGLGDYRSMVINHETGHWLGLGHRSCARRGDPAPVMMQQSKGLGRCTANAWPLATEVTTVEAGMSRRQHRRGG